MEKVDEIVIERYVNQDIELKECVEYHRKLEQTLEDYNKRIYLTPQEEVERKNMQKMKLLSKDKIYQILSKYRDTK
jgi:uncharacterized protein